LAKGRNDVCFHFSPFETKYMLERGLGVELTVEEALERVKGMAERGLVPLANGGHPVCYQVCMCDNRGCAMGRPKSQYGYDIHFPSRFVAHCDQDKCKVCGLCVKRCSYGYISMVKDMAAADRGEIKIKIHIDKGRCVGCGSCVVKCPTKAMILKEVRPVEYLYESPTICALDGSLNQPVAAKPK
jgi:ferredoxin